MIQKEIIENKESLSVFTSPLPFSNLRTNELVPYGLNLQQIVNQQISVPMLQHCKVITIVDGSVIIEEEWSKFIPAPSAKIGIKVVPAGGGGGKNPLKTILTIAIMVAAPYMGAALGTNLGLFVMQNGVLTAAQTAFFNGIVSVGFGLVGHLALNALIPPPKAASAVKNAAESSTQFIEGARNAINPYGVIPVCLGKNRVFPLQAAKPFTETSDNFQYCRQLFTWGYGEEVRISSLKLGETDLTEFNDFEIEHALEGNLHEGLDLYPSQVGQDDYNVLLSSADSATVRAVRPDSDEAIVDITFPGGLCRFTDTGERTSRSVQIEVQYAPVDTEDWSVGGEYKAIGARNITFTEITTYPTTIVEYIYLDNRNGTNASYTTEQNSPNLLLIAKVTRAKTSKNATPTLTLVDMRSSSIYGVSVENSSSFIPTVVNNTTVNISSGNLRDGTITITNSTAQAIRKSYRFVFPTKGDYKVRARRVTADTDSEQISDKAYLTAVRGIEYGTPVLASGLSGSALRIKATEQLNGTVNELNAILEHAIPDYDATEEEWVTRYTSNPASIFRYVLQGYPNAKALPDEDIDIEMLEDWHTYCEEKGYTYNRYIDFDISVAELLQDIASAGCATPAVIDNKRSIVIDREKDVVNIVTPRNSWGYTGEMTYPELPHGFRVNFRNEEKGYLQDERLVFRDGYNEDNATLYESLDIASCTNATLAWKLGRRYLANGLLRPETHSFMMDFENLIYMRGDRVKLQHDVPLVGVASARIKGLIYDSSGYVAGVELDDEVQFPVLEEEFYNFFTRIRFSRDGTLLNKELTNSPQTIGKELYFTDSIIAPEDYPEIGDLLYVYVGGAELDLIITKIEPLADLTAKITCLNYAPEIFNAETGTIPPFNSNITTPLAMQRPQRPVLLEIQSGVAVAQRNLDGSWTTRAVINLQNNNPDEMLVDVRVRRSGDTYFSSADILESRDSRVVLTGLDDGWYYDIWVRYKRQGAGGLYSDALQINNYKYEGLTGKPSNITNFKVSVVNRVAFFDWNANTDINFSHYQVRYNNSSTNAEWLSSGILKSNLTSNSFSVPFAGGTYLIKAINIYGEESDTAAVIPVIMDEGFQNVVLTLTEDPAFTGVKDNIVMESNYIKLADPDLGEGYYYFSNTVDLGEVFTSFVSLDLSAYDIYNNDIFEIEDIFAEDDLYVSADMAGAWSVQLQYRSTFDDPMDSGAEWSDWQDFTPTALEFRGAEFRLRLYTENPAVWPVVDMLSITVDMPDRIERGQGITVPVEGITIAYTTPFRENPALAVLITNATESDIIEFIEKENDKFTIKVYNAVVDNYVERVIDYIASGYGKKEVLS